MADMLPQGEIMPRPRHEPGHEETEGVSLRGVFLFAGGLIALGVLVHFALALAMNRYSARESKSLSSRPPMMDSAVEFAGPRLQGNPSLDRLREQERQLSHLNGYGWVDRKAGIVHIPIRRAIDLLADKGLPEVKAPQKPRPDTAEKPPPSEAPGPAKQAAHEVGEKP